MADPSPNFDEKLAVAKWLEMAPLLDRMMERVGLEGEFPVNPGSSLAGDDVASDPYQVSHAVRMCLTAGTDHLHATKVLVVDQQILHLAAPSSLARGALETLSAAYWILHPRQRNERVTRALRWHAKNMQDAERATGNLNLQGHVQLDIKLAKLDAIALNRGLDTKPIRRGYSSTETVEYVDRQATDLPYGVTFPWRMCSGFAHGRPWAYLGVSDREVADSGKGNVVGVRLTSTLSKALYPSLAAMHLLQVLLRLMEQRSTPL
jgi:hypothetical protein